MKQQTIIIAVVGVVIAAVLGYMFLGMGNNEMATDETMTAAETMNDNNQMAADKNIVQIASEADNFKTLVAAVQAAGLAETLSGEGPYTVFAPTDEAFAKLPAGTVEALLQDKEQLAKILTYHVVPGKVMASDVVGLTSAKTVEGSDLAVMVDGDVVKINDATVVTADIVASNGVIHVIDTVLMPQ